MKNEELKMKNCGAAYVLTEILHSSFFILHLLRFFIISSSLSHAARHAQRGAYGGEDAYQGLDDQTPNVFLVHLLN